MMCDCQSPYYQGDCKVLRLNSLNIFIYESQLGLFYLYATQIRHNSQQMLRNNWRSHKSLPSLIYQRVLEGGELSIYNIKQMIRVQKIFPPLLSFKPINPIRFQFSKHFLKDTSTQFQKELGLSDNLKTIVERSQADEKVAQRVFGFPFVIGVSLLVMLALGWNQELRRNLVSSGKVVLPLIASNLTSIKACQKWLLDSIYQYTLRPISTNSPTFLYQIQHYIKRNRTLSVEDLNKIGRILEYASRVVEHPPPQRHIDAIQRIVSTGYFVPELRESGGMRKMCELLMTYGDLEQQYLSLVVDPRVQVTQKAITRLKENLGRCKKMRDVEVPSYVFKRSLEQKQILFLLNRMKEKVVPHQIISEIAQGIYE